MAKRLVIDLARRASCPACTARCTYFYRPRESDHGIDTLREHATFALLCRRCADPSCVKACPFGALERQPDGLLKRYNLRCVSCGLCAHACPFGIIDPGLLTFYETPCDFCLGRLEDGEVPVCVGSCDCSAVAYREIDAAELERDERLHLIGDHLAVYADAWPLDPDPGKGDA